MKKCSFCHQDIADDANFCPVCGTPIDPSLQPKKAKWFHKTTSIVIGFFVVGPFVLPAVWSHPSYSKNTKIVVSVIVIVLTVLLTMALARTLRESMTLYDQIMQQTGGI